MLPISKKELQIINAQLGAQMHSHRVLLAVSVRQHLAMIGVPPAAVAVPLNFRFGWSKASPEFPRYSKKWQEHPAHQSIPVSGLVSWLVQTATFDHYGENERWLASNGSRAATFE